MVSTPARRRRPRQDRAKRTVARVLAAARELLVERGPEGFNTNAIARRAGVGVGSLYEYFPNKGAIVDRLIEELAAEETSLVLEQLGQQSVEPIEHTLAAAVSLLLPIYVRHYPLYRALWAMSENPREVGHRPAEKQIMDAIRARLEPRACELGIADVDRACFVVFHMVDSLCEQMAAQGVERWGDEACAAEVVAAVTRYLGL